MHGTDFESEEKRDSVSGMRLRPGTEGASVEPEKRAWRPTQMPKKGLPAAMWALSGSR